MSLSVLSLGEPSRLDPIALEHPQVAALLRLPIVSIDKLSLYIRDESETWHRHGHWACA